MSKGLQALEQIKSNRQFSLKAFEKEINIIEKELKRLEEIDNGAYVPVHINRYNELCDKEKALEIIKNKCSPLLKQYLLDLLPKDESKLVEEVLCEKEQKI